MKDLPYGICFLLIKFVWMIVATAVFAIPIFGAVFVLGQFGVKNLPDIVETIFFGFVVVVYGVIVVLTYFTVDSIKNDGVNTDDAMVKSIPDAYHASILYIRLCIGK